MALCLTVEDELTIQKLNIKPETNGIVIKFCFFEIPSVSQESLVVFNEWPPLYGSISDHVHVEVLSVYLISNTTGNSAGLDCLDILLRTLAVMEPNYMYLLPLIGHTYWLEGRNSQT